MTYNLLRRTATQMEGWQPTEYVSAALAAYPDLLNRYLTAKIRAAMYRAAPGAALSLALSPTEDAESKLKRARFSFREQITWLEPLRGTIPLTDKEAADNLAIGGLRHTAESVGRFYT